MEFKLNVVKLIWKNQSNGCVRNKRKIAEKDSEFPEPSCNLSKYFYISPSLYSNNRLVSEFLGVLLERKLSIHIHWLHIYINVRLVWLCYFDSFDQSFSEI